MPSAPPYPRGWSVPLVLFLAGAALRLGYTWQTDPRIVHDDHFAVMRIMLNEGRWPLPAEGWQTYQPPLYHALGALTYRAVAGNVEPADQILANPRHTAGRKAVQLISTVAGIGTLVLVWLTLRLLYPGRPGLHAVGLTFAAFLPAHIYMSAMSTNDSLTYLCSSLCVYAVLRASFRTPHSALRTYGWWLLAALAAALAMWTKQYGLGALIVVAAVIPLSFTLKDPASRSATLRGGSLAFTLALVIGAWPYVRTWRHTGNPLASNYTLRPHTMDDQMPGRLQDVSFLSFRPGKLLARPWRHLETIDSFWTQLYAKLWFDHDTTMTIYQHRPWFDAMGRIWRDRTIDGRERERRQLLWSVDTVPRSLLWQGRMLLVLGLVPTALIVAGVVVTWWRRKADFAREVLMVSLVTGLAAPFFQTVRQPFHSSMKAAFILPAMVALAVFLTEGYKLLSPPRSEGDSRSNSTHGWLRRAVIFALVALACAAAWHFIDLTYFWPRSAAFFPRLIPNH